jgi:hypothetical protein
VSVLDAAPAGAPVEPDAPARDASGPVGPAASTRVRRLVPAAIVLLALLLLSVVIGIASARPNRYLDADSPAPQGGRALRVLMEQQGVQVTRVASTDGAVAAALPGGTLFVGSADQLTTAQLHRLAGVGADVVASDVDPRVLGALAPGLVPAGDAPSATRQPGCTLRAALRAGSATSGGLSMAAAPAPASASGPPMLCYRDGDAATLAQVAVGGGRTVTLLGSGSVFTNARLARAGNAALGLNLLGGHQRLVWYVASTELTRGGSQSLDDLLPGWVGVVALQLVVVVLLAALWRGRRLGPVVAEPLPVVVRAAEATEGRARLYRRGGARDRAGELLRAASRNRLRPLVGASQTTGRDELVALVAVRSAQSTSEVAGLLYGAAPRDDAGLVRLADELDALERTVRTR